MMQDNIKPSKRCNVDSEEPGVTTSKVIVNFGLQFGCANRDTNIYIFPCTKKWEYFY